MTNIFLSDKQIIEIQGKDAKKFLQGLITNDIYKIAENKMIYSAMLNNQGRFLYDFFIFEKDEIIYLECNKNRIDEIFKKFSFYKLKSDVSLKKNELMKVFVNFDKKDDSELCFVDPRSEKLGYRIYKTEQENIEFSDKLYHQKRINLKIAEGEYDLTYEKSIINEFEFDNLNAVDYDKGCYIGQELTARTHHLGKVRKKIFSIKIDNLEKIAKNQELFFAEKKVGKILSTVNCKQEANGLALLKVGDDNFDFVNHELLTKENNKVKVIK